MSLFGKLFLLFILVPVVELALLIRIGQAVGLWTTVGLVVVTGFLGAALARAEGMRTVWTVRTELARGRLPGRPLLDGACILVGGALLLTPGFLTDLLGFALLVPVTRRGLQRWIRGRLERGLEEGWIQVDLHGSPRAGAEERRDGEPEATPPRNGEIIQERSDDA